MAIDHLTFGSGELKIFGSNKIKEPIASCYPSVVTFHPTWLPGAIKASDWSKFQSSFRESLKQIGPSLAGMFLWSVQVV
jgi:hypothetical protein